LIEIGSKTAEKNCTNKQTNKQTDRQTDRHYENNGHLAVNQQPKMSRHNVFLQPPTSTALFSGANIMMRTIIISSTINTSGL